jgi:hypothetical protein
LIDIYKYFFQDKFGPGHIISDTASAGTYLRWELDNIVRFTGKDFEAAGWQGNFVRVSLRLVKDSLVSYEAFFRSFMESVTDIEPISQEEWIKEWKAIDAIVCSMNLNLPNYENDRLELFKLLESGKFAMHHSESYEKAYEPHYRIMDRKHAKTLLQPVPYQGGR